MDTHREDRYGSSDDQDYYSSYRHSRDPSRSSDAPLNHHDNNSRRRPSESPPRRSPAGEGFRPAGGGGGGFGLVSGQKRGFPFFARGGSPDRFDKVSFAKLFVGSVPRTATEEDIRPLFEAHGDVIEVALIKDRKTGQQQGCCFIIYGSTEEADQAIRALHNQHTLPGGIGPIQVRYADGERERLGALEYKLFVGSMNKQVTEKEIEEIFSQYGRVEDVYLMRDDLKQSRGCGFVKYSHREMALAAINALNGCYTMRGCDQPLTVRFADPKRPKPADSRGGPAFGGPGFGPRVQGSGPRPVPYFGDPLRDIISPNAWHPMSPPNLGPSSHGFGGQLHPRSGDMRLPVNVGGHGGPADSLLPAVSSSSTFQQGFSQPMPQLAPVGQQISPLQKPIQSPQQVPPSLQLHPPTQASYSQAQPSLASLQQLGQPQILYSSGPTVISQPPPSQQLLGSNGQPSVSHPQVQPSMASAIALQSPPNMNLQSVPAAPVQQQQQLQPLQRSPSQLAQMLSQQKQALQASFQSSRQAFSQLQQQLQLMQPSNQGVILQQSSQDTKPQQQQWAGAAAQTAASLSATTASVDVPSYTSAAPTVPVKCPWTEHISPDNYKYYYNSVTGESKWEKPEELILYEQQQQRQKAAVLQNQSQLYPQRPTAQQVSQTPQIQLQPQFQMQAQQQFQQPSLSSMYQASGIMGHPNIQGYTQLQWAAQWAASSGQEAAQEWMWKSYQAGSGGA